MNSKLRIAAIGTGNMARCVHGPSWKRLAEEFPDVELVCAVDRDAERAAAYARDFGYAESATDAEEMLNRIRPDGVTIAVNAEANATISTLVLHHGIPVLSKKPPAMNLAELRTLLTAARRPEADSIVPHQVAFNRRYTPIVSFFETLLLKVWYPCTVATLSNSYHRICRKFLQETADSLDALPFMLHDFGYRGVSSEESAQLGGAAHLLNFKGTDNVGALLMLRQYYHAEMAGFSVPAAEHSTITSWSKTREVEAYEHLLDTYQNSVISIVVDSYDYYKTIEEVFCGKLAESWPLRYEDSPTADCYRNLKDAQYREGIYVGYRYYDKAEIPLRWAFGSPP